MTSQTLRTFLDQQILAVGSLAALGVALEARATGSPLDPALTDRIQDVLAAFGVADVVAQASPQEAAALFAELRHAALSDVALLDRRARGTSWAHHDAELLQAFGEFAKGHAMALTRGVIPALGLAERLGAPGAAFLDIGVGVAGLAIGMAQAWPKLRIVGVDVWQPALALARANVARAEVADRIELREQSADEIPDEAAFDLAWVPLPFLPERVLARTWERTRRSLRKDGWIVVALVDVSKADPKTAAVWGLRLTTFGGPRTDTASVEEQLRARGFSDVKALPGPPGSVVGLVVGRAG